MNNQKNKKVLTLALLILILILLVVMVGVAYARFIASTNGSVTAQVANVICTMEVTSSSEDNNGDAINPADKTIINPYCIVTVKDFETTGEGANQQTAVTQADISYLITVTPKKDNSENDTFTMPEYTWYEISSPSATTGTRVATSTALSSAATTAGNFRRGVAETRYYKIVFSNSGEQDVTRYVDFELRATQVGTAQ